MMMSRSTHHRTSVFRRFSSWLRLYLGPLLFIMAFVSWPESQRENSSNDHYRTASASLTVKEELPLIIQSMIIITLVSHVIILVLVESLGFRFPATPYTTLHFVLLFLKNDNLSWFMFVTFWFRQNNQTKSFPAAGWCVWDWVKIHNSVSIHGDEGTCYTVCLTVYNSFWTMELYATKE